MIDTDTLPGGLTGQAYSADVMTSGGPPGLSVESFSVVSGQLPPGITLNSRTGMLTGTPTALGTYNFTIRADRIQEDGQQVTSKALSIVVGLGITTNLAISSISPNGGITGSDTFVLTINGTGFDSSSTVSFGSVILTPVTVDPTQITVTVPFIDILSSGSNQVSVTNSGGASSNSTSFVLNPTVKTYSNGVLFPGNSVALDDIGIVAAIGNGPALNVFTENPTTSAFSLDTAAVESGMVVVQSTGDGDGVAVGSPSTSSNGVGTLNLFTVTGRQWPPTPPTPTPLLPATSSPFFGSQFSLSDDGSTVAAVDPANHVISVFGNFGGSQTPARAQINAILSGSSSAFPTSVSLSGRGDILVAADPIADLAFLFKRPSGGWAGTNTANAEIPFAGASIVRISADGATIVLSDPGANGDTGSVQVFVNNGVSFVPGAILSLASPAGGDSFGSDIALSSDATTIVIGAPGANAGKGQAAVFQRPTSGWSGSLQPNQVLTGFAGLTYNNGTGAFTNNFGVHVAISTDGTKILVGGIGFDAQGTNQPLTAEFK